MFVYVLNMYGEPLMPCKPRKARKLLEEEKAKVVNRTPFTIQLLYGSSGYKQQVNLGVDAGSQSIVFLRLGGVQGPSELLRGSDSRFR